MKDRKEVIYQVLSEFLGQVDWLYDSQDVPNDEVIPAVLDEDEIHILTEALVEALERNENQN